MKNKSHKRVKFTRINPLSVGIALVIGLIWCCTPGQYDDVYVAEPEVIKEVVQATSTVLTKKDIEEKIKQYFPRSWRDMVPVAYAESGLNPKAQNWNCYYNKDETIVYTSRVKGSHSTACKKSHRIYSWSVDCGIMQLNVRSKTCPVETIDEHLQKAADLSRIQGKQAWVTFNRGMHLTYK